MNDLLAQIRKALPWFPPEEMDDVVQEVAILVLEGRIDQGDISGGLKYFMPELRRRYKGAKFDVSLDQPIGDEDSSATLADVISAPSSFKKQGCPNCRKKVTPGRTYCRPACARAYYQKTHRKLDPQEVERLNKHRWLSRDEIAHALGVTRHAVNNVISRHGLSRFKPDICKIIDCTNKVKPIKNFRGHIVGNLCEFHLRKANAEYTRQYRIKRCPPKTKEQRSEQARRAVRARWDKNAALKKCS